MAIKLPKTLPSGVTGDYWILSGLQLNFIEKRAIVHASLYLNEEAYGQGRAMIFLQTFTLEGADFPVNDGSDLIAYAYKKIMDQPEFAGAMIV